MIDPLFLVLGLALRVSLVPFAFLRPQFAATCPLRFFTLIPPPSAFEIALDLGTASQHPPRPRVLEDSRGNRCPELPFTHEASIQVHNEANHVNGKLRFDFYHFAN